MCLISQLTICMAPPALEEFTVSKINPVIQYINDSVITVFKSINKANNVFSKDNIKTINLNIQHSLGYRISSFDVQEVSKNIIVCNLNFVKRAYFIRTPKATAIQT